MKVNFQLVVLIVFILAFVVAILIFSGALPIGQEDTESLGQGTVTIWGTESGALLAPVFEEFNNANKNFVVQYVEKSEENFNQDLLEALASGTGPDMFFIPDDFALSYNNKIFTIPYSNYPVANFQSNFVSAGEVFTTSQGILALPLAVDPLVMYYNQSMLEANNIVYPPTSWGELIELVPKLTKKDESNRIIKSAIAFGQYSNVDHAKDIISMLFMQAGNPIIREENGTFFSVLNDYTGIYSLSSILKFYTDFADPLSDVYSWNRSFPNSSDTFTSENLAFYFGYGSELRTLINRNPNQNFFVAPVPQIQNAPFKLTGAKVTGIAISNFSKNFNTAYIAANLMSSGNFAQRYVNTLGLAPARRDLLLVPPNDAYSPTFYSSALYARSWLDPSPEDTDNIFKNMVDSVISNNLSVLDAIADAQSKLSLILLR